MKWIAIAAMVFMAACKSTPERPPWWRGASLDAIVKRMGRYPESQREVEGVTIYEYTIAEHATHLLIMPTQITCTLDIVVGADKRVTSIDPHGERGACSDLQSQIGFWDEAE